MARTNKRSKKIAIVTAALMLGVGGTAYAYWTSMGDGTGTAGTGNTVDVIVNQTSTVTGLYPGGPAQALSGNFDNPNDFEITVGEVSAVVSDTGVEGCLAAWYEIVGTTAGPHVVPAGTDVGGWSGLTIALVNNAVNQDACKGATITIEYTVDAA